MLGSLAETYVEAIRSGKVPCLESAVESLAVIHNGRAITEALKFYRAEMERKVKFPTETQEALSMIHTAAEKLAISIFINESFNDQDHKHQQQLVVPSVSDIHTHIHTHTRCILTASYTDPSANFHTDLDIFIPSVWIYMYRM